MPDESCPVNKPDIILEGMDSVCVEHQAVSSDQTHTAEQLPVEAIIGICVAVFFVVVVILGKYGYLKILTLNMSAFLFVTPRCLLCSGGVLFLQVQVSETAAEVGVGADDEWRQRFGTSRPIVRRSRHEQVKADQGQ